MNDPLPTQIRGLTLDVFADCIAELPGLERSNNYARDKKFLYNCPVSVILSDLPRLGKLLDQSLSRGDEASLTIDVRQGTAPSLPPRLFEELWEGARAYSPVHVKALRQVLHLFSKLVVPVLPDQLEKSITDFLERNSSLVHPSWTPALQIARDSAHLILGGLNLLDIIPRHGPGAVATGERPAEKMVFRRIYRELDKFYPVDQYFFLSTTHLCDELRELQRFDEVDYPQSKLRVVPKDFRGPRLISMEPLEVQWIQQGQARVLVNCLEKHPLTRGRVNFSSQLVNRNLAFGSSCTNEFCTLDLKDASDRVSHSLVRSLFPKGVFECLNASRSVETILPDGHPVPLNMMSPMGSAICFPVESIVFFIIALGAIHTCMYPGKESSRKTLEQSARNIYVYGDDVIVRAEFALPVMQTFDHCGFILNDSKCCFGPRFRESCGLDAYSGVEVTPVRIKRLPNHRLPETLSASTDTINNLSDRGLKRACDRLNVIATAEFGPIPLTTYDLPNCIRTESKGEAWSHNQHNFRSRWNRNIQQREYLINELRDRFESTKAPVWSEAFRSVLLNTRESALGYPVLHRGRLIKKWQVL